MDCGCEGSTVVVIPGVSFNENVALPPFGTTAARYGDA